MIVEEVVKSMGATAAVIDDDDGDSLSLLLLLSFVVGRVAGSE